MQKLLDFLSLFIPQSLLSSKYIYERMERACGDQMACDHNWYVVAAISSTVELQVQCFSCGIWSEVPDPTTEEWDRSYGAMENPYPWEDESRVRYNQIDTP